MKPTLLLLAAAAFVFATGTKARAMEKPRLDGWELAYPTNPGGRLNSAAWGPDRCVAVGEQGRILHSVDGHGWEESERLKVPDFTEWSDVTYGNGSFVAVGGNYITGVIATSTDGISWEIAVDDHPGMLRSVSHGNDSFVAVGQSAVLTSGNGGDWLTKSTSWDFINLSHGNGTWLAIDPYGSSYRSTDLVTWTGTSNSPFLPISYEQRGIAYGNGRFVIAGGYYSQGSGTSASVLKWSTDGSSWLTGAADDSGGIWGVQSDVTFANGFFVVVGASTPGFGYRSLLRSLDGEVWSRGSITFPHTVAGYVTGVAGRSGKPFVAVSTSGEILISPDGLAWAPVDDEPREYFTRLHFANGLHVALAGQSGSIGGPSGRALVFTSHDGVDWTPQTPALDEYVSGLAFGNGLWVITGDDGRILTSPDAVTWTDHSLPPTFNDLRRLAFGNGRFVALSLGRDRIYHSTDGSSWTMVDQPFGQAPGASGANAIEFLNGRFRIVGADGLVACSGDGLSWQSKSIHPTANFYSVAFGKGRLILGGSYHHAVADGESPFTVISAEGDSTAPRGILYSGGWFVSSDLRLSRDGVHWSAGSWDGRFPFFGHWNHAIPVGDRLIACSGLEIRSLPFSPTMPVALPLAEKGAEFLTRSVEDYRIWSSDNLSNWTATTTWQSGTGDYILVPDDSTADKKFWKLETRQASP